MKNPSRVQRVQQFTIKGGTLGATRRRKNKDFKGQGHDWKEQGMDSRRCSSAHLVFQKKDFKKVSVCMLKRDCIRR